MIGQCPKCGNAVVEGESKFFCRSNDCDFSIAKKILEQPIDQVQASKLLSTRRTDLLYGFISKSGNPFPAYLVMDNAGKITFEFPDHEPESEPEPTLKNQKPGERLECKPLINAATKDLFRTNAFRITGLVVDATNREISKHVAKLKLMAELGQSQGANTPAFAINPPPTVDDIRDAIQKLNDPERRVIDELFWFWPEQFGQSQSDGAIQALTRGDSRSALAFWVERGKNTGDGVVARHNLAIYWHLMAMEWEHRSLNGDNTDSGHREIEDYWRKAFIYWEPLATEDDFWEKIVIRIRQLDDAGLDTGFARRMRSTLPEALDKINAELALTHAQKGNLAHARLHIQLMRETHQGLDDVEKTSQLVLSPAKTRLRQLVQQAKRAGEETPETADKAARNLLEQAKPLLDLFDLFHGQNSQTRNDLYDEVAEACVSCAVDHQKKTGDDLTFVYLLEQILPLAASSEARQRINKNIAIGEGNLAHAKLRPIYDNLNEIKNGRETPAAKLARIRDEVESKFNDIARDTIKGIPEEASNELSDNIAFALRGISIDSCNDFDDMDTAIKAIYLATNYAVDPDLKRRIKEDVGKLEEIKRTHDSKNISISIRNDRIEVTSKLFKYNTMVIPVDKVTGIRFGIFTQYTNGVKSSVSYTIGLLSSGHGTIDIECKRFFRSEEQAKMDFEAILDSCFYHIIPGLVTRLAKQIASGQDLQMGDSWLTSKGIRTTVGILMWKEEILIPWSDSTFNVHQGHLNLFSKQNKKVKKSYALRDVWNAVIFEQITKQYFKLRT
jgi:hypothetical protein